MITQEQKQKIFDFIKIQEFGVIATNSLENLAPESAIVAFSETEDLEIVIGSFIECRKNKNILRNQNVSFVIGWDNISKTTIQIERFAVLLEGKEKDKLSQKHIQKNKDSSEYLNDPRQQYFKIIPRWIRYSNFSVHPQEIWETYL